MLMKKKTFFCVTLIVVLAMVGVGLVMGFRGAWRYGFLEGRVLIADNGAYLIVLDDHSVIKMSDETRRGGAFLDLQTGDKIRILHDGIRESYPGQTGAYSLRVLEKGSADDIPADVVEALRQIGWIYTTE